MNENMFCEKCGKPVADGVKFCPNCGAPMKHEETPHIEEADTTTNDTNISKNKVRVSELIYGSGEYLIWKFLEAFIPIHVFGFAISWSLIPLSDIPYYHEGIILISGIFSAFSLSMNFDKVLDASRVDGSKTPFYKHPKFWLIVAAFIVIGVVGNKFDTSTPAGETRDYVKNKMPIIMLTESNVNRAYEDVVGENYIDDLTTFAALKHEIIPNAQKWLEDAEGVVVEDEKLNEIHNKYVSYVSTKVEAFELFLSAIEQQNEYDISRGSEKIVEADTLISEYITEVNAYCEELGIESNLYLDIPEGYQQTTETSTGTGDETEIENNIVNEQQFPTTTYFIEHDEYSEQGAVIILEPDGTCAYLAVFVTSMAYYYGNYEYSADSIVLHLTLDDGSILDIPLSNNGSTLTYTGTEAIRLTYPGAIYDKSEGIPESVQLFPPYIDSNVDSQELSMEEAQKLIEEYYMTLPNAEKPPKLEYSMLVETASGSFHEFFQFDLSGEKANDMYAVDANTGKIFMYSLAWDHYIPIEEYMQATFAFTDPWTGVRLDPGTGDEIDTGIFVITTADPSLNMRTGPDLGYDIIGEIPVGTTVEWLGEEGDWSLVEYQHYTGYVSTEYIEESYTVPIS